MMIYNVTVKIETSVHEDWLDWMKKVHVPEVMATGYFLENNIYKVMVEEEDGITFSVQYTFKNMLDYEEYQKLHAPALQKAHIDRYRGRFVAFRTLLQKV